MNDNTSSRFWVSRTEPLTDHADEPSVDAMRNFLDRIAVVLKGDPSITEVSVLHDTYKHEVIFSGVIGAEDGGQALNRAAEVFGRAIETAGGEDDADETAQWRTYLLQSSLTAQVVELVAA